MSDMSFKQAKEISERLELSEITLKNTLIEVEIATSILDKVSKKQLLTRTDNKITNLKILLGINIGFIIGLLVAKYFL
jgi:hypothetical protein